jgi:hypothetical protein
MEGTWGFSIFPAFDDKPKAFIVVRGEKLRIVFPVML